MFPVAPLISTYSGRLNMKSYTHKPEHTYTSERIRLDYTFNVKIEEEKKRWGAEQPGCPCGVEYMWNIHSNQQPHHTNRIRCCSVMWTDDKHNRNSPHNPCGAIICYFPSALIEIRVWSKQFLLKTDFNILPLLELEANIKFE